MLIKGITYPTLKSNSVIRDAFLIDDNPINNKLWTKIEGKWIQRRSSEEIEKLKRFKK